MLRFSICLAGSADTIESAWLMDKLWQHELMDALEQSASPVERDIAAMLRAVGIFHDAMAARLGRYHRKVDVAKRLFQAYDGALVKAASIDEVSEFAYLALAAVFADAATRESAATELSRASMLRWCNSAYHCLDHAEIDVMTSRADLLARLSVQLRRAIA